MEKSSIIIEYCPKCNWLLRAAYMAQEILTTFAHEVKEVTLKPSETNGRFTIYATEKIIFDRKEYGGFAEIKEIKQLLRDVIAPGKTLGHTDTPVHHN
jgi:selenoprotein W-related protein